MSLGDKLAGFERGRIIDAMVRAQKSKEAKDWDLETNPNGVSGTPTSKKRQRLWLTFEAGIIELLEVSKRLCK